MTARSYTSLISIENIFQSWEEFKKGKRGKYDVQILERNLENNLFELHHQLKTKTYRHGSYQEFYVNDPKRRHIHKAQVCDRIVHHLLYKYLYDVFDKTFIYDSYSCRLGKGTHKAVLRLEKVARKVSKNYTQSCWAQKLDIKKFFASVDHGVLIELIYKRVNDQNILWLIKQVVHSFAETNRGQTPKGIPLGNVTSQIFANLYLNELDQFIKHNLKIKYLGPHPKVRTASFALGSKFLTETASFAYLRYADDFIILGKSLPNLFHCFETVKQFLLHELKLDIHPKKIIIRKLSWGIDFCGYIVLPYYALPRTKTERRIIKKIINKKVPNQSMQSYLGYFSHADSYRVSQHLKNIFFY